MTRAAIYSRVSTQEQADSRLGLMSQETLCLEAAVREGLSVVETPTDPGVSGSIPLGERKAGRKLCEMVLAGEVEVVIALTQDRLFRSLLDALSTLERWDELGVRVLIVDGGWINMDDDDNWLQTAIKALFAEKERRDTRKRTQRALKAAQDRGVKIGGVPYGHRTKVRVENGKRIDAGAYEPVEAEQGIIARILEMRVRQMTYRDIAAVLRAEGVPTLRGGNWAGETCRRITMRCRKAAVMASTSHTWQQVELDSAKAEA